jgi:hypothetical protein
MRTKLYTLEFHELVVDLETEIHEFEIGRKQKDVGEDIFFALGVYSAIA